MPITASALRPPLHFLSVDPSSSVFYPESYTRCNTSKWHLCPQSYTPPQDSSDSLRHFSNYQQSDSHYFLTLSRQIASAYLNPYIRQVTLQ